MQEVQPRPARCLRRLPVEGHAPRFPPRRKGKCRAHQQGRGCSTAEARRVRTKDRSLSLGRTVAVNVGTHPRLRGVPATQISGMSWGDTPHTCFQNCLLHGDVRGGAWDRALPLYRGPCEPPPGGRGGGTARLSVLRDTALPLGVCAALLPRTWGFTEPPRPARLLQAPAGRPGPVALGRALSLCHGGPGAGDRSHAATKQPESSFLSGPTP